MESISAILKSRKNLRWPVVITIVLLVIPVFFSGGNDSFMKQSSFVAIGMLAISVLLKYRGKLPFSYSKSGLLLCAFVFVSILSIIFSVSVSRSLLYFLDEAGFLLLAVIIWRLNFSHITLENILKWFLAGAVAASLIGFYFYLIGNYDRLTSTFYWPNIFAGWLLFSLPAGFYFATKKKGIIPSAALIIILAAFLLTGSRGATLSLAAGLALLFYYQWRFFKIYIFRFLGIILLAVALSWLLAGAKYFPGQISSHLADFSQATDSSAQIKISFWQGALAILKDHPVSGSGMATFNLLYPQFQPDPISSSRFAHDFILEIAAERGAIAALLLLALLFSLFSTGNKKSKVDILAAVFFSGLAAFLLHGLVDVDMHWQANMITLSIWIGILTGCFQSANETRVADKKSSLLSLIILFFSILIIFKSVLSIYQDNIYQKARLELASNNLAVAKIYFEKIPFPDPDMERNYGIALYSLCLRNKTVDGNCQRAREVGQKLASDDSKQSLNFEFLGHVCSESGDFDCAKNAYETAINLDKYNHPEYYGGLAQAFIKTGNNDEAKKILQTILSYYPEAVINYKKWNIMPEQTETSGIEKEIERIKNLLNSIK